METTTEIPEPTTLSGAAPKSAPYRGTSATLHRKVRSRQTWKPAVLTIVGALALVWAARFALNAYRYEETDDAYIAGHLHQISPQISGPVKQVFVTDNQEVKAGDLLAVIDPLETEIAVAKARATLEQARAQASQARAAATQVDTQLGEANARVLQADAQLAQTKAQRELAQLTLARDEQLFGRGGVITQADLDNARSASRAADAATSANEANVTAAHSGVESAKAAQVSAQAQISAADANVTVAETALRDAERTLAYTKISAPTDGRVGNKSVESGNRVTAGQTLMSLAEPNAWIVANFKETQLTRMHTGQPVDITIDALPGRTFTGKIDSLAPASGAQFALLPPDNATGNFNKVVQRVPVKIILDEASLREIGSRLRLGLSVITSVRVR
jgi:membrane fusion protein (multidrug efflux system)